MKKKTCCLYFLSLSILLCGCGKAEETSDLKISVSESFQANMKDNPYFNVSDLTYAGKEEQNIAIGYDFENPEDNDPVLVYDKYYDDTGAVFCFDTNGRLCQYKYADVLGSDCGSAKAKHANMQRSYTTAELQTLSKDIVESCLPQEMDNTKLDVSFFGGREYLVTNKNYVSENEGPLTALVDVDIYGNIQTLSVSYNTLSSPVDYDYFKEKLDNYIDQAKEIWDIADYTCEDERYQQIGDKIYAMYTITFEETDGALFCESVGFTKEIESNDEAIRS